MKALSKKIYLEILDGAPLDEIQKALNLPTTIFSKHLKDLRDNGFRFQRTIFSNGSIKLEPDLSLSFNPHVHHQKINVIGDTFKTMFISDTHIGNMRERLDYIKIAYQYAKDHGVHIIFNGGDVIDNIYPENMNNLKIKTLEGQINKTVNEIPDIPGTITLCLYGNHEAHSLTTDGIDVARIFEDKRYDFVSLGYGCCRIEMKQDAIGISHFIKKIPINDIIKNVSINFRGNSHKSKTSYKESKEIYIPTLSDNISNAYEYKPLPGFLAADIIFHGNQIERINTTHLSIVNDELRMCNEDAMVLRKVPIEKRNPKNN